MRNLVRAVDALYLLVPGAVLLLYDNDARAAVLHDTAVVTIIVMSGVTLAIAVGTWVLLRIVQDAFAHHRVRQEIFALLGALVITAIWADHLWTNDVGKLVTAVAAYIYIVPVIWLEMTRKRTA